MNYFIKLGGFFGFVLHLIEVKKKNSTKSLLNH